MMKRLFATLLTLALLVCGMAAIAEGGEAQDVQCAIEDGSYVIRIPDPNGDLGWLADDMAQDNSVVELKRAELVDDEFVVQYDPTGDGDVSVHVGHYIGIACDRQYGWDLTVKDGAVVECSGGSYTAAPDAVAFDPYLLSGWETEDGMAVMLIEKNPSGSCWDVEITFGEGQGGYVFMTTIYYDCALDRFVYDKGKYWKVAITDSDEAGELGEASVAGTTGYFVLSGDTSEGWLEWTDDQRPEEAVKFARQSSDYTYYPEIEDYAGEWVSGDYSLEIVHSFDDYNVMNCIVTRMTDDHEGVCWIYDSCAYDDVGMALSSLEIGVKSTIVKDDAGELESSEEIYTDGAASFKLNDDGTLTWTDCKETPGADETVFEKRG